MSNHLAVATVTAVVRKTLQDALDHASPAVVGARVTTVRPNAPQADLPNPGINIFLYQTSPSVALRNSDLPRRRADMTLIDRPQVSLDLHYLLTFHGADPRLEPQILHGIATRALHERPVITRAAIEAALADPVFSFLAGSDLADAVELSRLSPVALSVEEMGKLWSIFYQIPYVLSAGYRASVVTIESDLVARGALPVRQTSVRVQASPGPSVDRIAAAGSVTGNDWILAGQDVVLTGRGLRAPVTRVQFDSIEVVPDPAASSDAQIRVTLPSSLAAGVHGAHVVHRRSAEPSTPQTASNIAPFVLHPTITAAQSATNLQVTFAPPVGRAQRVVVLLDEVPPPSGREARAYVLKVAPRAASDPATATNLSVPLAEVLPGSYLVRAQVDGAESPVTFDPAANRYNSPKVTIA